MRPAMFALAFVMLTACGFVFDKHIDGPYRLVAVDEVHDMMICYKLETGSCLGRTPSTTTGYGYNDKWITAEVRQNESGLSEYYFIDRNADHEILNADDITQGPFNKAEFMERAQALGLPPVSWRYN